MSDPDSAPDVKVLLIIFSRDTSNIAKEKKKIVKMNFVEVYGIYYLPIYSVFYFFWMIPRRFKNSGSI